MANKKKSTKKEVIEEANYGKTILACVLIIIILIGGYLSYKKIYDKGNTSNKKEEIVLTNDEIKFKKEYETLNGTNLSDGEKLKKVSVIDDNNIVYTSLENAISIIKEGSGVIYFAYPTDNMSRIATPILLTAMSNTDLDKINYVSVRDSESEETDFRDVYTIDKKKAKKVKESKEGYSDLLELLDEQLPRYTLSTSDGKIINVGEKRLQVPTLVVVLNGKVVSYVEGTVKDHDMDSNGVLRDLTKDEITELTSKYTEAITSYLDDGCEVEAEEGC